MGGLQRGGVPRKLTRRFLGAFHKLVSKGVPPLHAAQHLGVHRSTFYAWLRMAETADEDPEVHRSIRELRDIIDQAQSEAVVWAIETARDKITTTADALKYLAKIAPAEFGDVPEQKQDVTVNQIIIGIVQGMAEKGGPALPQDAEIDL